MKLVFSYTLIFYWRNALYKLPCPVGAKKEKKVQIKISLTRRIIKKIIKLTWCTSTENWNWTRSFVYRYQLNIYTLLIWQCYIYIFFFISFLVRNVKCCNLLFAERNFRFERLAACVCTRLWKSKPGSSIRVLRARRTWISREDRVRSSIFLAYCKQFTSNSPVRDIIVRILHADLSVSTNFTRKRYMKFFNFTYSEVVLDIDNEICETTKLYYRVFHIEIKFNFFPI